MFSVRPSNETGLDYYTCVTLIDITKTDVARHYNKGMSLKEAAYNVKRNQHRNYQTFLQVISLRCQPIHLTDPIRHDHINLADLNFGSQFGVETVWAFTFATEQEDVFVTESSEVGLLLEDMHNVPIILDLEETADINVPMLNVFDSVLTNTIIIK